MSSERPEWERLYKLPPDPLSQYQPLVEESWLKGIETQFDGTLVNSVPGAIGLLVDAGAVGVTVGHDGQTHISIDRITNNSARLRPLSYLHHTRCFRALDRMQVLAGRGDAQRNTLRSRLTEFGLPHAPDSDLFPTKLGISCLIAEGTPRDIRRILTTMRSKDMSLYAGMRHTSFSGGADTAEAEPAGQTLNDVLARAAGRECEEELALSFPPEKIRILGVWRDLERLSAQAFGILYVDDLDALAPQTGGELTSFRKEPPQRGFLRRLSGSSNESPELRFMRRLIASKQA
ncbi:MAG: hypothetical protein AAFY59_06145 [Pseudomonadota bacterium]